MGKNLAVRNNIGNAFSLLIHHHCRHTEGEAAIAEFRIYLLDGVANSAGKAVAIKASVALRNRVQRS